MLDTFEILTTSGVVLWSRSFVPVSPSVVNSFISDVFIEEKNGGAANAAKDDEQTTSNNPAYRADQHTVKWSFSKELGVIFVAVYRSLLHLSWIDKLVDNLKTIFIDLYGDQLKKPNTTVVQCRKFDEYFNQQLRELESSAVTARKSAQSSGRSARPFVATDDEDAQSGNFGKEPLLPGLNSRTSKNDARDSSREPGSSPAQTPNSSRPTTPAENHLVVGKSGPGGRMSRRARRIQSSNSVVASSGDEKAGNKRGKKAHKTGRKWDVDGFATEDSNIRLDYSEKPANGQTHGPASDSDDGSTAARSAMAEGADSGSWGTKTSKGQFLLKDFDDEVHDILASAQSKSKSKSNSSSTEAAGGGIVNTGISTISTLFHNVVGGKTLTKQDLAKPMEGMYQHLIKKNVAPEAAERLRQGVEKELIGLKTASFESIDTRIKRAMEASLTKMLTPTSSLDLLREIDAVTRPSAASDRKSRPYVMSIVGVNGVGKSTNLSKICYFLLQNKYKVLVVAGDTFRSGAVEQLKVHVRNLKELTEREGGQVEIFEKGYGGDAATVAKDAVRNAAAQGYDVVLIDTAGRRHNDQRLMSSLEKFAKFAVPDKILMVGEALVGNDSVAQARNFNSSFGPGRTLDGFIISKCDTVGDMVGTLVSLVHATNVPVLFVGIGQHYSDIRNFSVRWAVEKLLSSSSGS